MAGRVAGELNDVRHYGLEHFGLTVDNMDAAVTELRAKAAEIAVGPVMRNPGLYLACVRGPEGVMVELVQSAVNEVGPEEPLGRGRPLPVGRLARSSAPTI